MKQSEAITFSTASKNRNGKLPVAAAEDVEFSAEQADAEDLEAQERAAKADRRQQL
ncbi:YfhD family protein [Paenibacillus sp. SYP-B4298]|uniref:YfhD family protein n=1 Tax=Paenibacillus sp. SYP-B4298 TaxID=2996034 RepID=UPI0022DE7410|nr:YfhD family protein [Paenibacillus sp. SYP-B4298]